MNAAELEAERTYAVAHAGEPLGTFTVAQIAVGVRNRKIPRKAHFFDDASGEWLPIYTLQIEPSQHVSETPYVARAPYDPAQAHTGRNYSETKVKDRGVYALLAFLLGFLGAHDLYAENFYDAILHMAFSALTLAILFIGGDAILIAGLLVFAHISWIVLQVLRYGR